MSILRKSTPKNQAAKLTKSWKFTMITFVVAMILPMVNAQLPEERQVDEEWAANLIYMALGYSAVGAAATAVKRVKPTPPIDVQIPDKPIDDTMVSRPAQISSVKKNPEAMSNDELVQMVYELKQQAKQGKA